MLVAYLICDSFLVSTKVIIERLEHLRLANLCLDQFCLPLFDDGLESISLTSHVQAGDFAFFDYSITNWVSHLDACLFQDNLITPQGPLDDLDDLPERLCIFLDIHWAQPKRRCKVKKSVLSWVRSIPQLDSRKKEKLLEVVTASIKLSSGETESSADYEALKLYGLLQKVREMLEQLAEDPVARLDIEYFYGGRLFKCPRLYCKWFYEGFERPDERNEHLAKHQRSFYCPYIGCASAIIGCTTASDLEEHLRAYHEKEPTSKDFPQDSNATTAASSRNTQKPSTSKRQAQTTGTSVPNHTATGTPTPEPTNLSSPVAKPINPGDAMAAAMPTDYDEEVNQPPTKRARMSGPAACHVCSKVFSKPSRLSSHMRTHTDAKPYGCSSCGRAFAREPDLTRHEALHSERKHACGGYLKSGAKWGCGKKFTRADGLARHFKGETGKLCMKPLRQQEENAANLTNGAQLFQPQVPVNPTSSTTYPSSSDQYPTALWNPLAQQVPQIAQLGYGAPPGMFAIRDEDHFPDALYEQYPALEQINWHLIHPEPK